LISDVRFDRTIERVISSPDLLPRQANGTDVGGDAPCPSGFVDIDDVMVSEHAAEAAASNAPPLSLRVGFIVPLHYLDPDPCAWIEGSHKVARAAELGSRTGCQTAK